MDDGLVPAWREKLQKNKGNSNYIYDILAHSPSSSFCISVGHFVSMPLILVYPFPHPPPSLSAFVSLLSPAKNIWLWRLGILFMIGTRPLIVLFLIKHLSTLSNELGINEPLKDVSLGIVDSDEKVTLFFWIIWLHRQSALNYT